MPKYTETQTRKLISAYGGVGSIIETTDGAVMIDLFNRWKFFKEIKHGGEVTIKEIEDKRLLKRLQYNFEKLERFIAMPPNSPNLSNSTRPQNLKEVGKVKYFPEWMYCTKCHRFKPLEQWWSGWQKHYTGSSEQKQNSFTPPKCFSCFNGAKAANKRRKFRELEQVRFILISPDGKIEDIPWERWTIAQKHQGQNSQEDNSSNIDLKFGKEDVCCNNQDLRYETSTKFSDLAGVNIRCMNPKCKKYKQPVSLSGLFGLRTYSGKTVDETGNEIKLFFKPVIRTSNSVYYPLITSSIYLPHKENFDDKQKKVMESLYQMDTPLETIAQMAKLSLEIVKEFLTPDEIGFIPEEAYRLREYQFLLSEDKFQDKHLSFVHLPVQKLENLSIDKLIQLRKLKLTSVQTAYTRQEPLDKDSFARKSDQYHSVNTTMIKARFTSDEKLETTYLPAIESFGEGIFINLDKVKLDNWFDQNFKKNEEFTRRIYQIQQNAKNDDLERYGRSPHLENPRRLAKFILIHTFSHLLIKELEFLAGYPATSLQERLYINDSEMQGIMIYTIAGAEGSYGGLISQAKATIFKKVIDSALARAKDCASDPVCYHTQDGQGIGGLNFAACYSCALLPETSCEEFNCWLDRALLIDESFGFLNDSLTVFAKQRIIE